jgi:hypothetical protein
MKKIFVMIALVLATTIFTFMMWYCHPGFDPIVANLPVEEGASDSGGYYIQWKIFSTTDITAAHDNLLKYGYKIDASDTGDGYQLSGGKEWLSGARYRRLVEIKPAKIEDLYFMNKSLAGIGATTTVRIGDHYIVMWSAYGNDWNLISRLF